MRSDDVENGVSVPITTTTQSTYDQDKKRLKELRIFYENNIIFAIISLSLISLASLIILAII